MTEQVTYYFECLRCGEQSNMTESPPRCPKCNCGNGIVTERQLPQPVAPATQAMSI